MAIIELGNLDLVIGDNPVAYNAFEFQDNRAYIIFAEFDVSDFDDVFSTVFIYPQFLVGSQTLGSWGEVKSLEVQPFTQFFYLPLSSLLGGRGECILHVIRVSKIYGGADGADVKLKLFYDDDVSVRTWLS